MSDPIKLDNRFELRTERTLRTVVGEHIDRTAVEEACQILGHDPADVLTIVVTARRVLVFSLDHTDRKNAAVMTWHNVR